MAKFAPKIAAISDSERELLIKPQSVLAVVTAAGTRGRILSESNIGRSSAAAYPHGAMKGCVDNAINCHINSHQLNTVQ